MWICKLLLVLENCPSLAQLAWESAMRQEYSQVMSEDLSSGKCVCSNKCFARTLQHPRAWSTSVDLFFRTKSSATWNAWFVFNHAAMLSTILPDKRSAATHDTYAQYAPIPSPQGFTRTFNHTNDFSWYSLFRRSKNMMFSSYYTLKLVERVRMMQDNQTLHGSHSTYIYIYRLLPVQETAALRLTFSKSWRRFRTPALATRPRIINTWCGMESETWRVASKSSSSAFNWKILEGCTGTQLIGVPEVTWMTCSS